MSSEKQRPSSWSIPKANPQQVSMPDSDLFRCQAFRIGCSCHWRPQKNYDASVGRPQASADVESRKRLRLAVKRIVSE